jgi:hypothetical protein
MIEVHTMAQDKKDNNAEKGRTPEIPIVYVAAFFIIFIALFYFIVQGGITPPVTSTQNQSQGQNMSGDINSFRDSLMAADSMGVVMNVTDINSSTAKYVYACGAGLSGSWGKLGKNISNLYIYVIDGDSCTSSRPIMTEGNVSNATESKTSAECAAENRDRVAFDIRYGPGYSIFTERTAYIFVDETFVDECSFQLSGQENQPVLTGGNITDTVNITRTTNSTNVTTNSS